MSEPQQLFDLVVTGHSSDKPVEALVRDILTQLNDHSPHLEFKLSDALLFNNGMVSIRDNITQAEAEAIIQQLLPLQVQCDIRPTLQIVPKEAEQSEAEAAVYTCPACGHQQPKRKEQKDGRLEICEVCGIVGERYHQKQRLQEVIKSEQQKHENERSKRIREVLERAKQDEEAMLQQEARRRLGLAEKPDKIGVKIAAVVATLGITFGTVYYLNQPTEEEIAQQEAAAAEAAAEAEKKQEEAMMASMQKATKMAEKLQQNMGAAGSGGAMDAAAEGNASDTNPQAKQAPSPEQQQQQQREQTQVKMTEALKSDAKKPETPEETTERQVKTQVSATAITEMEGQQLTAPRFQITQDEHAESRRRILQLLKLDEADLTNTIIEQTSEAYPRTLLMLDIAEWQWQHRQPENARKTIARIQQELEKTQDVTQQALILGGISKAHLMRDEWEQAGQSLQQATEKALSLPETSRKIELLARLANEQTLFGNQIAAQKVLEEASKLTDILPEGVEPRSNSFVQLASGYAMITDFASANRLLPKVEDPAKRQKLAEFIDKLQLRVEQVRAEYQQAAASSVP